MRKMKLKRFSDILNSNNLPGFTTKNKNGKDRKLDQDMERLQKGNVQRELTKGLKELETEKRKMSLFLRKGGDV